MYLVDAPDRRRWLAVDERKLLATTPATAGQTAATLKSQSL